MNRIESCNFEAGAAPEHMGITQEELIAAPVVRPAPVCEQVARLEPWGYDKMSGYMRGVKDGAADGKQKQKEWI